MKLLPESSSGRPLAIMLLLLALVAVYLAGFHWWVQRHVEVGDRIGLLTQQIARYKGTVEMAGPIRDRLATIRASQQGSALFLDGNDANIAGADLIRTMRDLVASESNDPELCQIINQNPRRATDPERFQAVQVDVRMQCPLDDFLRVLFRLESGVPMVFVDNLVISQRMTPDQRSRASGTYGQLDIRFNMIGYINQPGPGQDQV